MKKGKWNYSEEIEYSCILVQLLPVSDPPMHWQNAFAGEERQLVKVVAADGYTFYIDNEDGSGIEKIKRGGGPDSYSAHVDSAGCIFIRDLEEEEWKTTIDIERHKADRERSDLWQQEHYPEQYKKIKALREGIIALQKNGHNAAIFKRAADCAVAMTPQREKITGGNEYDRATGNIYAGCTGNIIGKSVNGKIKWFKK